MQIKSPIKDQVRDCAWDTIFNVDYVELRLRMTVLSAPDKPRCNESFGIAVDRRLTADLQEWYAD
jgi:hypothetical protein